jgi:division protein CdvB (Snf7/Vps24/ESCRT-III family)
MVMIYPISICHSLKEMTPNRILLDEISYDVQSMQAAIDEDIPRLNNNQNNIFDAIVTSVFENEGKNFFV